MLCFSDASDVLIEGAIACISIFNFMVLMNVAVNVVVCVHFKYCLVCVNVTFMCVMY